MVKPMGAMCPCLGMESTDVIMSVLVHKHVCVNVHECACAGQVLRFVSIELCAVAGTRDLIGLERKAAPRPLGGLGLR